MPLTVLISNLSKTDFPYDRIVAAQLKPLWTAP
jgi:hypothetical protein